ncbi:tyrosine-type recombinase/integrase [Methylobacterium sp. WSM2598]|uniref:tyrosine-type recombinase/integrase n=1 Tax=Methylobacterium sp. WSM2598 TaxID=398261 RepID=UPI0012F687D4|nr:tyrosine-type recombinase/integrase [Methylobacterium sp. WSM2598]
MDGLLTAKGVVTDEASRTRLIEAVDRALVQASEQLGRNADGDYRPDPQASRFPEWTPPAQAQAPEVKHAGSRDALTVSDLYERWFAYQEDKKAANTLKRYRASLRSLADFTKGGDARMLTPDEVYAWAVHRRDSEGVSVRAINKNDLVAASSIFKWAMSRPAGKLVDTNPVSGVRLDEPKRVAARERTFREAEVSAILKAALSVPDDPRNPTFSAAKRWCPWLAAYSGARISELTHLRAEDVREEGAVPVVDLRVTKGGRPRTVPVHPHLVEQGFLRFVKAKGTGPLFYDPKRHTKANGTPPGELRAQKVAKWVREAVKLDTEVDPNHGWRHTWKTRALGAGIEERIRDAITGHRVATVGRQYETPSLLMLAGAMERFPRYNLGSGPPAGAGRAPDQGLASPGE